MWQDTFNAMLNGRIQEVCILKSMFEQNLTPAYEMAVEHKSIAYAEITVLRSYIHGV